MVFSSLTFLLLFLPVLLLLYFLRPGWRWRNGVLVAASLLFYGWGEPVWILAMVFSTAVNYLCALLMDRSRSRAVRKLCLALGVIISLGFLFYFKYAAFFGGILVSLTGLPLQVPSPRLPIGISFYTFQVLTYTVDVYRKKADVQRSFFRLLLYVSCFPQLIAGPIVQYSDVAGALTRRRVRPKDFSEGLQRFIRGLGKKVLLANICGAALSATAQAGTGADMSLLGAWLSALLYTLQIYFDFSAYSDMAIGLGRVLGFTYKENFNYPYTAVSVTDFWRRWHISLSSFFRDYVYIPLGGNRRGGLCTARNMLIVWMLTGLWHGASWNFILWGLYYGLLLLIERFVLSRWLEALPRALRHVLTMLAVIVGWVIFYYVDLPAVGEHLLAMIGLRVSPGGGLVRLPLLDAAAQRVLREYGFFPALAFLLSLPLRPWLQSLSERFAFTERLSYFLGAILTPALLGLSLIFLIGQSYNPFIYFRF
ncbi:MAG: MBOAT family protein [Oscillospiraceae bacterium]|nr:MBOAT family protein [Oscillospiraceae bacterium]